jgi:NAD(P)H-flavin reductase
MQETQAIIQRVRRINPNYQHLDLAVEPSLSQMHPGQSLMARLTDRWEPYLREQWWPVEFRKRNTIVIERSGEQRYEPGQPVKLLGPVGSPFRFRRSLRHILLLAYDTAPTILLPVIPLLLANNTSITLALLGSAAEYDTKHLSPEVEIVHGDPDLNWPGRVMTVGLADQVFAVVAPDDELLRFGKLWSLFTDLRADVPKNYLFGVFAPVQPCGAGACGACMIRMKEGGSKLNCMDGPALDLSQVVLP